MVDAYFATQLHNAFYMFLPTVGLWPDTEKQAYISNDLLWLFG